MATKDWKKNGKDYWQSINPHKANQTLSIESDNSVILETHLYSGKSRQVFEKQFKTKTKANAFTKAYMRKH